MDQSSHTDSEKKVAHSRAREADAAAAMVADLDGIDTLAIAPDLDGELREAIRSWLHGTEWTVHEEGRCLECSRDDLAVVVRMAFDVHRPREKTVASMLGHEGARIVVLRRTWTGKAPDGIDAVVGLDCKQTAPITRAQLRTVTDAFVARYRERHPDGAYRWADRHFANAKRLIREYGVDDVVRRIGILFDDPPRWLKPPYTFDTLVSQWNVLVVPAGEARRAHDASRAPAKHGRFEPKPDHEMDTRAPWELSDEERRR